MENADEIEDVENFHQIQNKYTFWFRVVGNTKAGVNYNDSIKKIATFQTVEHFWRIYDYLKRPKDLHYTEYHLFKDGITPTWEDPQNKAGGKWMIRLKKGIASRYWEDIILAIIGEQFDVGSEVCGAVLSVRSNEDIVSIWNKSADNLEAVNKIRDQLRRLLRLPALIAIEYKRHQDSLQDKSSYRNPTMVWRAPSRQVNNNANGEKPHGAGGFNSFNRTHEGAPASATGYPKQAWKPNRTEDSAVAGSGATGGYRSGGSAWNKPARDEHAPAPAQDAPRQGGWARGQAAPVPAPAVAPAPAAAGMSSATAALQAAVGIKTASKPAPAPAAAAPPANPWKKGPAV